MGNLGDERLDEAHCLWALCSHPCCWEAERRIAKGTPRRAVGAPTKRCPTVEESLPCLSVVDVSEWAGRRKHPEQGLLGKTVSSHSSEPHGSVYSFPSSPLHPRKEKFKCAGLALSALSSAGPTTHSRSSTEKGVKLNSVQISPVIGSESSPWGSGSVVLWVPNPRHIPQCITQKRSKSPHCAVKEILCLPASLTQKTPKVSGKSEGMKKKVRFQLPCLPLTSHPGCQARLASQDESAALEAQIDTATVSSPCDGEEAGNIMEPGLTPTEHGVSTDPGAPRESRPFLLKNKPVVLHSVQERAAKRASKNASAALYKLDSKTREESIDWESLKGQAYLWKRHNLPQQKECRDRLCPPGAAKHLETPGLGTASKVILQPPLQNQLSVVPAAWYCMKDQQECRPSTAAGTHTLPTHTLPTTALDTAVEAKHCLLHRMQDTEEKRERPKGWKGAVIPLNSPLCCHRSGPTQHDGECEGPVVQAAVTPTAEAVTCPLANSAHTQRLLSGALEPWRALNPTETGLGHRGHTLSTPPPSLSSL